MKQQVAMQEHELKLSYLKMQFEAQTLLNVNDTISLRGDIMKPAKKDINMFMDSLKLSPEYRYYEAKIQTAKEELALKKSTRYGSPELYAYSKREPDINNNRNDISGFGFRLSVPLWDRKDSQIEIQKVNIQKNSMKAEEVLYSLERNIKSYHTLYNNILKELKKYKNNLLEPSKKYYEISTRSFELGEKSLLELLDAQTLYFENQLEYQTLISESNFYWLQLCNAASLNLLKDNK
jgi:cobalt-zinc-cadmium efflux system outer membrane protein